MSDATTTTPTPTTATTLLSLLEKSELDSLSLTATSFASVHGILVERRQTDFLDAEAKVSSYFECAPISLLPNAFPRPAFEMAQTVAPLFNQLVEICANQPQFLRDTLQQVVQADPFTAKLLQLYQEIYHHESNNNNFAKQADRLGIFRSDYMLHKGMVKQVELNTIAASFGALATRVSALHQHLTTITHNQVAVQEFLKQNKNIIHPNTAAEPSTQDTKEDGVPDNIALERLAQALHLAAQRYQTRFSPSVKPIILFVVQPGETNTVDQRLLEFQITQAHGWRVLRKSLTELAVQAQVDEESGYLLLGEEHVAVVYYRAGYTPTDYFGPDEWKARQLLENSVATKSPCLGYHLVGTKKVQQALARPGVLENLLTGEMASAIEPLRSVFAGLYSLGQDMTPDDYQVVQDILLHDQKGKFVLKPQREGGGHNFYGQQLLNRLQQHVTISPEDDGGSSMQINHAVLSEYILMERLFPPEQPAILLRHGQVEGSGSSISELGCFGTILCSHDGQVLHNDYAGYLLRTKFSHVDEGGVAAGFATLSSPYLV